MKLRPNKHAKMAELTSVDETPRVTDIRWSDLLQRDMSCWTSALAKNYLWLLFLPILFGGATGFIRLATAPKQYESTCSILRVEKNFNRTEYAPMQRNEIKSLILRPSILAKVADQLQAPYLRNIGLIGKTRISADVLNERNSNLFEIKVRTPDQIQSAQIANAIGEAFVYSRHEAIRSELEQKLDANKNTLEQLNRELDNIQQQLRIMEQLQDVRSKLDEAKSKLRVLEKNYTEANPRVIHQRILVLELEMATPPTQADIKTLEDKRSTKTIIKTQQETYINKLANSLLEPPDIEIQEWAQPPPVALSRKISLFTVAGAVVGFIVALSLIILRELLNFKVRSAADFTHALHLPVLGTIPELAKNQRVDFYAALQETVSNAENSVEKSAGKPLVIAVAPYNHEDLSSTLLNEICEILSVRMNMKCRIIHSTVSDHADEAAPYLINDLLYGLSDEVPRPKDGLKWFFMLDDLALISPPQSSNFDRLKERLVDCDVIFWELFNFESHRQLFSEITQNADMTVILARYNKTNKIHLAQLIKHLRNSHTENIYGLLYDITIKIYRRIVL